MEIAINKAIVDGLVTVCAKKIAETFPNANSVEVLVALSQLTGRVISAQEGDAILHNSLSKMTTHQTRDTIKAIYKIKGISAKGIR